MFASIDSLLKRLAAAPVCGYQPSAPACVEPTALTAMALLGHGRNKEAAPALDWLSQCQSDDGSLGISAAETSPQWPTSLAVLAWRAGRRLDPHRPHAHSDRAVRWILSAKGHTCASPDVIGHDASIAGWSWVGKTHCWIEPTAFHVLALQATGHADHPRSCEGLRMLVDRLLPDGGCNYGNTTVFGQVLRPHMMPTSISLLAMAAEETADPRIAKSLDYLIRNVTARTTPASLSFAILALAAHQRPHPNADTLLANAADRTLQRDASPYKLALVALAALSGDAPLLPSSYAGNAA